jgi:alpha-L-rhamnosidase
MTTEHWFGTFTGENNGHTWSHPWSASPARIIPQFLMGVRPLERGWRRIAVHPQPGSTLTHAKLTVPTLRGDVELELSRAANRMTLQLTVPGNTRANVCLPVGLLDEHPRMMLNGVLAPTITPAGRDGQLCLQSDLLGGAHTIVSQ